MNPKNYKAERNARIMELWGLGWSQDRIARKLGLSQTRVGNIQSEELHRARKALDHRRRNGL